ncbi:transporter [Sulfurifustis variabilis]|uniref:Transporter n=1 Tax=Sulfurifustis variabilis TaxID=1675686 RepID=A0A1B4V4I8_9GAMM|nr:BON domain-containing protein [Sulfurifustis variabilis]BAU47462.1 transporter [Sulfurifustis variabilis]
MKPASTVIRQLFVAVLVAGLLGCAGAGQTTGEFVDDSSITTKVKTKLFNDPATSGWQISVRTDGGVVYLTGVVASATEKARAGELARSVAGVKSVRNELTVK